MTESTFARVLGAAEERRVDRSYFYDNSRRGGIDTLVVQRTLSGAGFFENAQGRQLVLPGRAMLFTHRERSRYGYPPEATAPYRLRFLGFPPTPALRSIFDRLRQDFGAVVNLPEGSAAAQHFDEALERFRKRTFEDAWQESELLFRMLIALYREQVSATRIHDPIEYGSHYLRNRFRSPVNLKQVAAACGVSREHFIRAFHIRYGEPPGAVLRRLRLEHARAMLDATSLPVEEIALASGFASLNTFGRAFRARYGQSPGRQRRR